MSNTNFYKKKDEVRPWDRKQNMDTKQSKK